MSVVEELHDRAEVRIGELMGVINASTAALVAVISDVVAAGAWSVPGIRSPQHWVAWQCGVSPVRAQQLVLMATRRAELPCSSGLFDEGRLTEDTMAAIARRTPVERDAEVAELAPVLLYTQLTRWLASLPKPAPDPEPEPEPERREVSFGTDGDRWKLRADLPADEGALVELALTRSRSQVFHEHHPDHSEENPRTSGVTWADGLVRMAETALIGLHGVDHRRRPSDRYQLLIHFDVTDAAHTVRLHLGALLPDPIQRYLTCDADVRAIIEGDGMLLAMSERCHTVSDRMRAFIEHRDGGCVVPGCTQTRWLHIHHLHHWEDGGPTESPNLCALCPLHHRLHHTGWLNIDGDPNRPGGLTFSDRHGRVIGARAPDPPHPPPHPPPEPYQHPTGQRADWSYFHWQDLNHRRHDTN